MWALLRRRGYRTLLASLTFSLFASGAWTLAAVWQVLALGGGVLGVSVVSASAATASVLTFLLGGVLADRVRPRRLLTTVEVVRCTNIAAAALASLTGHLTVTHLAVAAAVQGVATGLYLPSYSTVLVRVLDADQLLAANGLEGTLRPVLTQALGPAVAGALVAQSSPGAAVGAAAVSSACAAITASRLPAIDPDPAAASTPVLRGLVDGMRHVLRTRWLLTTLLFSSVTSLLAMGPIEVLTPFVVTAAGGGPAEHSLVLAALGVGAAGGSLAFLVLPLPRRYLSMMTICWALSCLPLAVFALSSSVWAMVAAGLVMGALFNAPMVVWGTVLQRRVPRALLGRVAALDFFVSLGLLPLSVALAGPVGSAVGLDSTFLVAALVPQALAVVAVLAGRVRAEEAAHPLAQAPRDTADSPR